MTAAPHVLLIDTAPGRTPPSGADGARRLLGEHALFTGEASRDGDRAPLMLGTRVGEGALLPPGASIRRTRRGWIIEVDPVGLLHLYVRAGPGWAAVSTSATALASLEPVSLDEDSLAVAALLGHHMDLATAYLGVTKLPPAGRCTIEEGRLTVDRITGASPRPLARGSVDTVQRGVLAVRRAVEESVDGREVLIELSGGLDSRVLVAALTPELRRCARAFTIGDAGDEDLIVARAVASALALPHEQVSLHGLAQLEPEEARIAVDRAGWEMDWASNAVAGAVLEHAERAVDQGPRLSGQNGEFGRGFYYALQPQGRATPHRAALLARWRVLANDRIDRAVLCRDVAHAAEERVVRHVTDVVAGTGLPFLEATDELYLSLRMQHWVGPGYSTALRHRLVLAPFFHPDYLQLCRSMSRRDRRGSRLLGLVLEELEPRLASIPLAGGARAGGPASRLDARAVGRAAKKVASKAHQRLTHSARPQFGTSSLATLVQRSWEGQSDALAHAARSPLVDPDVVADIAEGRRPATPATVAFLAGLDALAGRPMVPVAKETL